MWMTSEIFWESVSNMTDKNATVFVCAVHVSWLFGDIINTDISAANYAVRHGIIFG